MDNLLVYGPLIHKLDRRCEIHEIAEKSKTAISKVAPNPSESDGKMYGADDHPLVCGQFPSSSSSPVWWRRAHPRGKLGQLHIIPYFLQDILPENSSRCRDRLLNIVTGLVEVSLHMLNLIHVWWGEYHSPSQ